MAAFQQHFARVNVDAMVMRFVIAGAIFLVGLLCGEHAHAQAGNLYQQGQLGGEIERGVVVQTRNVEVQGSQTNQAVGTGIGAALGGALGNRFGGTFGLVAGGAIGTLAGNIAAQRMTRVEAQEVLVQLYLANGAPGRAVMVVQPAPFTAVSAGQPVYVTSQAGQLRIIPVNGAPAQQPTVGQATPLPMQVITAPAAAQYQVKYAY